MIPEGGCKVLLRAVSEEERDLIDRVVGALEQPPCILHKEGILLLLPDRDVKQVFERGLQLVGIGRELPAQLR